MVLEREEERPVLDVQEGGPPPQWPGSPRRTSGCAATGARPAGTARAAGHASAGLGERSRDSDAYGTKRTAAPASARRRTQPDHALVRPVHRARATAARLAREGTHLPVDLREVAEARQFLGRTPRLRAHLRLLGAHRLPALGRVARVVADGPDRGPHAPDDDQQQQRGGAAEDGYSARVSSWSSAYEGRPPRRGVAPDRRGPGRRGPGRGSGDRFRAASASGAGRARRAGRPRRRSSRRAWCRRTPSAILPPAGSA